MKLLKPATLADGQRAFVLTSDQNDRWYQFFSSLEMEEVSWFEDALSLKRAFQDVEKGNLYSHEQIRSEMESFNDQNSMD